MTKNVIEKRGYHGQKIEITWEGSDLRNYLNGEFYSSFSKEKIISEGALQNLRENKSVTIETISALCEALDCQPGDIMEYVKDDAKDGE